VLIFLGIRRVLPTGNQGGTQQSIFIIVSNNNNKGQWSAGNFLIQKPRIPSGPGLAQF